MLRRKKAELYEKKLSPMSAEQFNHEIDQSMEDSRNGRHTKASVLKEKIKKWS